ncbi:IS3 family transposase [Priestia megaterium]|uniref:IS3 family transposase n=1 Tax=Priestia megaterium TaxID=1404 RepID=UPI00399C7BEB
MLRAEIQEIFKEHKGRYGSLRVTKVLEKKGIKVNRKNDKNNHSNLGMVIFIYTCNC